MNVVKYLLNQVQSSHTLNSMQKYTYFLKKKVVVTLHSFNGYRPQFYFRTTDVTGAIKLQDGVEMVMPGDNVQMSVELIHPIAMDPGLRFAIREGGRTVGAGVVAKVTA